MTDLVILMAAWLVSLMVVNPIGNFPLNDDWSFGRAVQHLVERDDFRPTGWASMPLLTNVVWGALFCLPAGFSFTALRLSTLTLSLCGMLGTYWLARELRLSRGLAIFSALVMGFNPITFALSNTFMTDVPFSAMIVLAVIFLFRNLVNTSKRDWLIGLVLVVAATLSRQLAIAVPLAFAVTVILREGVAWRNLLRAGIPAAACIGSLLLFQHWLAATGRLPANYDAKNHLLRLAFSHPSWLLGNVEDKFYSCLLYLGLFLSPILTLVLPGLWVAQRKRIAIALAFSFLLILHLAIRYGQLNESFLMPTSLNILVKSGIGPVTLRDAFILNLNHAAALPPGFWLGVTIISLFGAVALLAVISVAVVHLVARLWSKKTDASDASNLFLWLTTVIYLLPLLVGGFFDRYLIVVVPLLAVFSASFFPPQFPAIKFRLGRLMAMVLLVGTILFAIGTTRDYLEWNRVRWRAIRELITDQHVRPDQIDGGFEFGGLYFYDSQYQPGSHKSWWWIQDDTYQISFGPVPGFAIVKEYDYVNWLPPHRSRICVLKKSS